MARVSAVIKQCTYLGKEVCILTALPGEHVSPSLKLNHVFVSESKREPRTALHFLSRLHSTRLDSSGDAVVDA